MCGDMGKAVLSALTGALLCGLVSDAAYSQTWPYEEQPSHFEHDHNNNVFHHGLLKPHIPRQQKPDFLVVMNKNTPALQWLLQKYRDEVTDSYLRKRSPYEQSSRSPYEQNLRTPYEQHVTPSFEQHSRTPFEQHFSSSYRHHLKTPFEHHLRIPYEQFSRTPYVTYKYPQHSNYPSHYSEQYSHRPLREHEKGQDLRNVPGHPGIDYPVYHEVPETGFSCAHVPVHPGMYANVETGCQAYHVCHDGREGHQGASFLCTNGTLFDQEKFACDWWYNVDCSQAIAHYKLNADPLKNPYVPKPKPEELEHQHQQQGIFYKL